ncbi:MAG: hypothetical protein C5B49_10710 [Bdellovibrio sp.]|nr:MAG: hypothetical protein C5B49_10710 [Bdellovibrio sp.]
MKQLILSALFVLVAVGCGPHDGYSGGGGSTTSHLTIRTKTASGNQPLSIVPTVPFGAQIQFDASGGSPPYNFSLSGCDSIIVGQSGLFIAANDVSVCTVAVTDATLSSATAQVDVGSSQPVLLDIRVPAGSSLQLTPTGGTAPYRFSLTGCDSSITPEGLFSAASDAPETCAISVTDASNTVATATISVYATQPPPADPLYAIHFSSISAADTLPVAIPLAASGNSASACLGCASPPTTLPPTPLPPTPLPPTPLPPPQDYISGFGWFQNPLSLAPVFDGPLSIQYLSSLTNGDACLAQAKYALLNGSAINYQLDIEARVNSVSSYGISGTYATSGGGIAPAGSTAGGIASAGSANLATAAPALPAIATPPATLTPPMAIQHNLFLSEIVSCKLTPSQPICPPPPPCAAPPPGCDYTPVYDRNGCIVGCGVFACKDPGQPIPISDPVPVSVPPIN